MLEPCSTVIDFGCGQGRHSLELARCGFSVIGVDYVDKNIKNANNQKDVQNLKNVEFVLGDCREVLLPLCADVVICLYDVVGTYADNEENKKILRNIVRHLKPGGTAIISVMNYELTLAQAKNTFRLSQEPSALLSLRPSSIMETTGNIFDSDYYLVDTESGVVYRREQFRRGSALPVELIVRDKRFTAKEIKDACEEVGLSVEYYKYVSAKDWNTGYGPTDRAAKEILLKCKRNA